ncbi:MAG: putative membrane protein [Crocinitomicaceae bacterium]|jgi:putative membrane protein
MKERSILQYLMLSVKGVAMGAADVVPGVSGGTIAFITGIYEELIESLNNINLGAVKVLFKNGVKAFWKHINGTFFLFLFGGIIVSVFSLAKGVLYLLENHGVLLWSFFFGLIIASVWLIGKTIKKWTPGVIISLLIGTGIAFYISTIQTVAQGSESWYIVLCGAIAICAMILPGISGSFILVLLGAYHVVLKALKDTDIVVIGLFAIGCVIGLMSFARVLKFLFSRYKEITIALLTGFMIGSLYKVWPWKNAFGEPIVVHSDGKKDYMMANVLPDNFIGDAQLGLAIASVVVGLVVIVILERFSPKES